MAVDLDFEVRLTKDVLMPGIREGVNLVQDIDHALAGTFQQGKVIAEELDGVASPLHPKALPPRCRGSTARN